MGSRQLIVGGAEATPFSYSFLVTIAISGIYRSGTTDPTANWFHAHYCGGALISPRVVVTAAHCVEDGGTVRSPLGVFHVGVHRHDLTKTPAADNACARDIGVVRVDVHESYGDRGSATGHDIAVMILAADAVHEACVADGRTQLLALDDDSASDAHAGATLTLAGWGKLRNGFLHGDPSLFNPTAPSDYAYLLNAVELDAITNTACQASFDSGSTSETIAADNICTLTEGKGSCDRDSGGPLFSDAGTLGSAHRLLVGVVNWCACFHIRSQHLTCIS